MQSKWKPELVISIIALVVAVVSSVSASYFSALGSKTNVMPVLVFVYSRDSGWRLRNVGNGPALNVLVAHRKATAQEWESPTRMYPIGRGEEVEIQWVGHNPEKLAASYSDAHNRSYTSICYQDLTEVLAGDRLPKWTQTDVKKVWER